MISKGIWQAKQVGNGFTRCKRCGRPIRIKKDGQEYGPRCARKVANLEAFRNEIKERERIKPSLEALYCGQCHCSPCACGVIV